jgi:hypothetical protein
MPYPMRTTSIPARYRVISTLGSGGMATVVLAEDTLLGRQVALKRMTGFADARGLSRLRREALVGASVSHPNLVSIFDIVADEADGDLIIVMEYVRGETLRSALSTQGRLAANEALRVLAGVAAGLDAIHERGIVHRDVKPANILLGPDGTVKVADLGIALVPDRTRITTAGAVLGTFSYMAPEQLEDAESKPAIDIYALSAVAYEVLSGRKAREEPNPVALAHAISTQPPPDLRQAWPGAPEEAAALLIRGMARDPGARPRSAGELISRLRAALLPDTTAAMPTAPAKKHVPSPQRELGAEPVRRRPAQGPAPPLVPAARGQTMPATARRRLVAAALLALAAAAAVLAVILNAGGSPSPRPSALRASHRSGATGASSHAAASTTNSTAATTSAAASPGASGAADPVAAVKSFYGLAAAHRYTEAWALADPTFRSQLGSYPSFQVQQAGDISIRFDSAQPLHRSSSDATVAVRTTSVRTDGTKHCSGTVDLVPDATSGRWLLHQIHINCV